MPKLSKGHLFAFFKIGANLYSKEQESCIQNRKILINRFLEPFTLKINICEDGFGEPFLEIMTLNQGGEILNLELRRISGIRSKRELSIDDFIRFKALLTPYFNKAVPKIYLTTDQLLQILQAKAKSNAWGRK